MKRSTLGKQKNRPNSRCKGAELAREPPPFASCANIFPGLLKETSFLQPICRIVVCGCNGQHFRILVRTMKKAKHVVPGCKQRRERNHQEEEGGRISYWREQAEGECEDCDEIQH